MMYVKISDKIAHTASFQFTLVGAFSMGLGPVDAKADRGRQAEYELCATENKKKQKI